MNHMSRAALRSFRLVPTSTMTWFRVARFASNVSTAAASSATVSRPFHVLGVQQIAVGGLDKAALRHLWIDLLGCGPIQSTHVLEKENVDEDILTLGGTVEIDLMSPIDPDKKPKVSTKLFVMERGSEG